MDKISTPSRPSVTSTVMSSQSPRVREIRTSPAASTIAFLRQFARACYSASVVDISVISLN